MDYWDHRFCQKFLRTLNHGCWRLQRKYRIIKSVHFWWKILFSMVRFTVSRGRTTHWTGVWVITKGKHTQTHTHSVTLSGMQFKASSPNVHIFSCCSGWKDRWFEIKKEKVSNKSMGSKGLLLVYQSESHVHLLHVKSQDSMTVIRLCQAVCL